MSRHVQRIIVTELPTDPDNPEPWLVEWQVRVGRELRLCRAPQDSKKGAQRLVANLLNELAPGLTKDDALVVNRRD